MSSKPYVWQMVKEAVETINESPVTNSQIKQYIHSKWGDVNDGTINAQILVCCVNSATRVYYPENQRPRRAGHIYDFLYKVDRGRVELFDPIKHGLWEIKYDEFGKLSVGKIEEKITGGYPESEGSDDNSFSFALESHLRDFLSKNLNSVSIGGKKLSLYIDDEGRDGIEFQTDVGLIDILAVDEDENFYVIELKVGKGSDVVAGQISRYMGWVKKKLADQNKKSVKGIIIANEIDDKLKYATSWIPDITIFKYSIRFDINETELD